MVDLRERLLGPMDLSLWPVIADKINSMDLQEGQQMACPCKACGNISCCCHC